MNYSISQFQYENGTDALLVQGLIQLSVNAWSIVPPSIKFWVKLNIILTNFKIIIKININWLSGNGNSA